VSVVVVFLSVCFRAIERFAQKKQQRCERNSSFFHSSSSSSSSSFSSIRLFHRQ
jgi:hypothetical protein